MRHLAVEGLVGVESTRKPLLKELQPPQRVHCVYRTFDRQINVKALEDHDRLFHYKGPLDRTELLARRKPVQCHGLPTGWPDDVIAASQDATPNPISAHWGISVSFDCNPRC